ncbi:MAG: metallophosphoesterase [Oscillibacter sp.]|nr:metallophosphoesterase [Oscillibacter sp.]
MLKLVHISDFHLNETNLNDWNDFVKQAFINLIKKEFPDGNLIIACTGDLLDRGGKDFGGVSAGLKKFQEAVINPIISEFNIPVSHFVCIPGNHDINHKADDNISVAGLISIVSKSDINSINDYARSLSYSEPRHSKRVSEYKEFEKDLYSDCANIQTSFLGTTFIINIGEISVGFAGFNSVWNCSGDSDKSNGICITEPQYKTCIEAIRECTYKVALMHHPLDWLEKENDSIQCWLKKDYDILLDGHVHTSDTSIITKVYGSLYIDTAPAFENDIRGSKYKGAFSNGVNIIEINDDKTIVSHKKYKYEHKTRSYSNVQAENLNFIAHSSDEERIVAKSIKFIKEKHYKEYDNSIIPHKASTISSLKDAFVQPPIVKNGADKSQKYSISEILNNTANIILFGAHESGKSTILYRMIMELIDNHSLFQTIPVYLDFCSIGNQEIATCIKSYLDCNSAELNILIQGNFITLFVDNYTPNDINKIVSNRLYNYIKNNDIRIIATHNSIFEGRIDSVFYTNNQIAFESFNIQSFDANNVRQLMTKWTPGSKFEDTNAKIQRMVSSFCSYSLPCSAMSVSLYLWSTENTDRKPVNPALLLDIYLEIILEKLQKDSIYRDSFDYENKIMLLATIAKYICEEKEKNFDFQMTYAQYLGCITNYLLRVGFEKVEADKIGNYFIEQKVFIKQNNTIIFAHSCFYYFLLAKKMIKDKIFKDHILSENEYYKYERVIDYYAGLKRSDTELLSNILNRFNKYFSPLDEIQEEINRNMDKCFTYIGQNQNFVPIIKNMTLKQASEKKGNQEEVERRANQVFDKKLSRIADDYASPNLLYPDLMIIMLCKALRNLDGVEDVNLKTAVYTALVKKSLQYTFVLKDNLARYANEHEGKLPVAFSSVNNISTFLRFMPFALQCSFHEIMGTTKLFTPIRKKIEADKKDKSISDIEKYFSVAMLWDTTGSENEKEIKGLIKNIGNNCVQDYIFNKIYYRFMNQISVGSAEENICINLLAELKVKGHFLKGVKKNKIISELKKEKKNKTKAIE